MDKKRKSRSGSKSQGTIPAFLLKTYEILENPVYSDIISWNKEGNAFVVKKINEFSEKILPKYFKHNNFASFVRQLNMYDFHKSRHENNENEFRHKLFKRGQKHLLSDIKRKISEGHGFSNTQLVPANKEFDVDKLKKETTHFSNELGTIKRHQTELEKVTKMIYGQNTQLLKENKLLWNELIKNKEKYEKKIEKLMMFIFSIMHHGNNQLGPSATRKSLTNSEISEKLSELTEDPEQGRKFLEQMPSMPDKNENEKFFQKISNYFQNKGQDTNIDNFLEQMQNDNNFNDIFKNGPNKLNEELPLVDQQNMDPNLPYSQLPAQPETSYGRRRSRRGKGALEESDLGEMPTKQIKTEPESYYTLPQTILTAQKPINIMNQEVPNEELRREMQPFSMGLSRGPSYLDSEPSTYNPPPLVPQKSSNDYMFQSPKPFAPMKEDDVSVDDLYTIDSFNGGGDKMPDFNQAPIKNELPMDDALFSPTTFINNPSNGFSFNNQNYDDNLYRN